MSAWLDDDEEDWPTAWRLTGPNFALPQLPNTPPEEREWKDQAACKDRAAWFVDDLNSWEVRRARQICDTCPVFDECRSLADEIEGVTDDSGDLAGLLGR